MKKKRVLLIILAAVVLLIVVMLFVLDVFHWKQLDLTKITDLNQTTIIYDADGQEIAALSGAQNRQNISLNDVPGDVQLAFLAAEDARYYSHWGIDVVRIGGALIQDIRRGGYHQGASTITQQLIKLTHLSSDKTLSRKAQEAWLALQLERHLSKEQILEAYLNVVYFGNGAYGIEAASQKYFDIPARELSLAQGAVLAAVIKSPSGYAPHLKPDRALERRNNVLDSMVEYEFITAPDAERAKAEPIELAEAEEETLKYAWYVDAVISETESILGLSGDEVLSCGFRITTALDQQAQSEAEALYENDANFPADASDGALVQSAMVAMDTGSGEVIALVGGRRYDTRRGLNRATQIRRQPGSAFKPISVYAAAIDQYNYLPSDFVDDTQRTFEGGYAPGNVGGTYRGEVTLRESLARSLNVATIDLLSRLSVDAARRYAEKAGITLDHRDSNLSLGLGSLTYGVSPMELNAAYAALSNGGQSVTAHLIREIRDVDGQLLYSYTPSNQRVMSAQSAYMITDMLISAVEWGTASALNGLDFPVAAKTGTVAMEGGGNRDAWTVAYTPKRSVAVWMGFDEPDAAHKLSNAVSGSAQPARLAAAYMKALDDKASGGAFHMPSGLTEVLLDQRAFLDLKRAVLASDITPKSQILREVFPVNRVPTEVSAAWNIPLPLTDFALDADEQMKPRLTFTIREDDAVYLVYRRSEPGEALIAELRGEVGEAVAYIDSDAYTEGPLSYYILPANWELYQEGKLLTGTPTAVLAFRAESGGLMDWLFGPGQGAEPTPTVAADESQPSIEIEPVATATPVSTGTPDVTPRPSPTPEASEEPEATASPDAEPGDGLAADQEPPSETALFG